MSTNQNLAFVFPGQGSQKVGMLAEFSDCELVRSTFREASEALDYDVWGTIANGPQEKLNFTEITQPIMLTSSVALWRVWRDRHGTMPAFVAGHSLGEWSALACVGVVAFQDAVRLVHLRGKYMQDAVPAGEGAMAAIIGLNDDLVERLCKEASASGVVLPVNYNSPGQLVIAGSAGAVDAAINLCKKAGAKKAMSLAVSAPFHTPMMKSAAGRLAEEIDATQFSRPQVPVVYNVSAQTEMNPQAIKALMLEQIYQPVKWVACINYMVSKNISQIIECGPGKVLSGLNKRIDKMIRSYTIETPETLQASIEAVTE